MRTLCLVTVLAALIVGCSTGVTGTYKAAGENLGPGLSKARLHLKGDQTFSLEMNPQTKIDGKWKSDGGEVILNPDSQNVRYRVDGNHLRLTQSVPGSFDWVKE